MFGLKKEARGEAKGGMWQRLRAGLARTRDGLLGGLGDLVHGKKQIDADLLGEIETRLLMADVGVDGTRTIIDALTAAMKRNELADYDALMAKLRDQMVQLLAPVEAALPVDAPAKTPRVILVVGVNGVGKTTTIAKLAHYLKARGRSVLLAAGDTFRAAAIEQIQEWGTRVDVPVIAQKTGADAAAVIYDALSAARARGTEIVIADTAGRFHNRANLMEELKKIRRTIDKFDADLEIETLLVIDAGTGQNAIAQAREFHAAVGLTGVALTKLDGTARGGVLFGLAGAVGVPVRFVGVGEQFDDLRPFSAADFVEAMIAPAP